MSFRFLQSAAGIKAIVSGPDMIDFVNGLADKALAAAHGAAPHGSGYYDAHLGTTPAEVRDDGVHAELWSSDPFWHIVEYGSVNNPPHRVLETAITSIGLDYNDGAG